jgi:hypothetical protein
MLMGQEGGGEGPENMVEGEEEGMGRGGVKAEGGEGGKGWEKGGKEGRDGEGKREGDGTEEVMDQGKCWRRARL